jgi:hypothetical protein
MAFARLIEHRRQPAPAPGRRIFEFRKRAGMLMIL